MHLIPAVEIPAGRSKKTRRKWSWRNASEWETYKTDVLLHRLYCLFRL